MPLPLSDCRRIIEGVFCREDLPDDLRAKFTKWMLGHENDPALQQVMLEIWSAIPQNQSEIPVDGLRRLLHEVDPISDSQATKEFLQPPAPSSGGSGNDRRDIHRRMDGASPILRQRPRRPVNHNPRFLA